MLFYCVSYTYVFVHCARFLPSLYLMLQRTALVQTPLQVLMLMVAGKMVVSRKSPEQSSGQAGSGRKLRTSTWPVDKAVRKVRCTSHPNNCRL
jgi:hypothetical protein